MSITLVVHDADVKAELMREAQRRNIPVRRLVVNILRCVTQDHLFEAVLDDSDENEQRTDVMMSMAERRAHILQRIDALGCITPSMLDRSVKPELWGTALVSLTRDGTLFREVRREGGVQGGRRSYYSRTRSSMADAVASVAVEERS